MPRADHVAKFATEHPDKLMVTSDRGAWDMMAMRLCHVPKALEMHFVKPSTPGECLTRFMQIRRHQSAQNVRQFRAIKQWLSLACVAQDTLHADKSSLEVAWKPVVLPVVSPRKNAQSPLVRATKDEAVTGGVESNQEVSDEEKDVPVAVPEDVSLAGFQRRKRAMVEGDFDASPTHVTSQETDHSERVGNKDPSNCFLVSREIEGDVENGN